VTFHCLSSCQASSPHHIPESERRGDEGEKKEGDGERIKTGMLPEEEDSVLVSGCFKSQATFFGSMMSKNPF